ncbi:MULTISPECIES: hypothetical protein [Pandoraea]|uniref:hypothetical protein n=1 Tax=Pandoraea TaxID=93217 RepID=UPI001F5D6C53|nr:MULTISPECIES: hypothetical protein [Pandoraea]MCI3206466.1 hypothetical protein [Pandoraea sp. LA3]MDN4584494.1 hypothetical protein [Pandoraea capi]
MAYFAEANASTAALEIIKALAESGSLKVSGAPGDKNSASEVGKKDGIYIAALLNTIYEEIRLK